MAASPQATAAMMKEMETAGPAVVAAARAVSVKMPAPITTATPKTVRSNAERLRLSLWPGSSVSLLDCSTDFVRQMLPPMTVAFPLTVLPGHCRADYIDDHYLAGQGSNPRWAAGVHWHRSTCRVAPVNWPGSSPGRGRAWWPCR